MVQYSKPLLLYYYRGSQCALVGKAMTHLMMDPQYCGHFFYCKLWPQLGRKFSFF